MKEKQQEFFFVECEGPTRRVDRASRQLKNRYAQLGSVAGPNASATHRQGVNSLPVQIKFKLPQRTVTILNETVAQRDPGNRRPKINESRCPSCRSHLCAAAGPVAYSSSTLEREASVMSCSGAVSRESLLPVCATCGSSAHPDLPNNGTVILQNPSTVRAGNPKDHKALSYFYTFAALDLSGYLPGRFWDRLVPQISATEPLVCKAVAAVGGAHLDHCNSLPASADTLTAHAVALKSLRGYLDSNKNPSHELVVLCCILLFAYCRLVDDPQAATIHVQTAKTILRNFRKSLQRTGWNGGVPLTRCDDTLHQLSVMLVQLDIEATMQNIERGPFLNLKTDVVGATFTEDNWNPELKFWSPHDAMEPWMCVCHDMWSFILRNRRYRFLPLTEVPVDVIRGKESIQARIKQWRLATKGYIRTHPAIINNTMEARMALDSRRILDAINALVIEAHYFSCKRFIAESLRDEGNPLRPFDRNPEALLRTAETVISLRQVYHLINNLQMGSTFSTHVGIVEALFLLAHRTSFSHIRARAQFLIRQFREVQRGLSGLAAFFAGQGAPPADFILIYERPGH